MADIEKELTRRIGSVFERQTIMQTLGARLSSVQEGACEIILPIVGHISQQHGFVHAGVVTTITDTACGAAAVTMMPQGAGVLTIEFKVNLLSPAKGERLIARGRVVKPGRNVIVTLGECFAEEGGKLKQVALMTASMMVVQGREGISD